MRGSQALEHEIRDAFAGAERRPAPPLVRTDRAHDPYYAELEVTFAAQGDVPDAAFLHHYIHSSHHLLPDGFRWFCRSLLLATLAAPWDRAMELPLDPSPELRLPHSSVYWLRPNPCAVLTRKGNDDDAQAMRDRLSPAERLAIARFLGLVLEQPTFAYGPHLAHLASQAISWCWRDDPAATEAAEGLRRAARSYERPAVDDPDDEALVVLIEQAFADTPAPSGALISFIDEESADYALELAGTSWQNLAPWFLGLNSVAFCFLTPAAFRYFMPAALRARVMGTCSNADPVFHLVDCIMRPSSSRDESLAKARAFSPTERVAISAYLRSVARYSSDRGAIEAALREFWERPDAAR